MRTKKINDLYEGAQELIDGGNSKEKAEGHGMKTVLVELFTYELCPHCDNEVVLMNKFEKQICPECKEQILPCSICSIYDHAIPKCINCPLENKKGN